MKCPVCGRELREDSKFCDWCSSPVPSQAESENTVLTFNYRALIIGILISLFITLLISGMTREFGMPLLFGGLFLPFFFSMKKKKKQ